MAKNYSQIYKSVYTDKNKMDFGNSMIRGNGIPLDITEVWDDLDKAKEYAASNPVAYQGQIIAVITETDAQAYIITPVKQEDESYIRPIADLTEILAAIADLRASITRLDTKIDETHESVKDVGSVEGGERYAIEYKDDCLVVSRQSLTNLIELKFTDTTATISRFTGDPIVHSDIVNSPTKGNVIVTDNTLTGDPAGTIYDKLNQNGYYTLIPESATSTNTKRISFIDNFKYAHFDLAFDITTPTSQIDPNVSYIYLGDFTYRVDYNNDVPSQITVLCLNTGEPITNFGTGVGALAPAWYSEDTDGNKTAKARKIVETTTAEPDDIVVATACDSATAKAKMFTPNNYHQFLLYKGTDGHYYILPLGAYYPSWGKTALNLPETINTSKFSRNSKGYELIENNTILSGFDEAFDAYDLIKAFKGESNLVTNVQPFALLSAGTNIFFGSNPKNEWVSEDQLGNFTYTADQKVTFNSNGSYTVGRLNPVGNYNICKIQDMGKMYLDDDTSICVPEIWSRGSKYGLHKEIPTIDERTEEYIQFIIIRCWSADTEGTRNWEEGTRIFYRTLRPLTKIAEDGTALVKNWSFFHEIITSENISDLTNYTLELSEDNTQLIFKRGSETVNTISLPTVSTENSVTYDLATSDTAGLIKTGYEQNGKNYAVKTDEEGNAYVNVPWSDTNTTYNEATETTAGLMSAKDKIKLNKTLKLSKANLKLTDTNTTAATANAIISSGSNNTLSLLCLGYEDLLTYSVDDVVEAIREGKIVCTGGNVVFTVGSISYHININRILVDTDGIVWLAGDVYTVDTTTNAMCLVAANSVNYGWKITAISYENKTSVDLL
ncbi:MAG: hypothetical protein J6A25_00845 [Lachnospiraceae bacterium]|nr:hypothetical protein [Lachnospiraceae bacterium]